MEGDKIVFDLTAPEASDLNSFAELELGSTDLAMWKKHLLRACEQNTYFKQTLISALIVVVNNSECKWMHSLQMACMGKIPQ